MSRRLDTCPCCRALLEPGTSTCPYCEARIRVRRRGAWGAVINHVGQAPASFALLLAILVVFAAELGMEMAIRGPAGAWSAFLSPSPLTLLRLGADAGDRNVAGGEWWRFATSVFIHIGAVHLLFNGWALLQLAPFCERIYGSARFLAVYLLTGLVGNAVSYLWHVEIQHTAWLQAGASGSLCGLLGLLLVFRLGGGWDAEAANVRTLVARWLLYVILFGVLVGADNAAHIGGAAGGLLLGLLLSLRPARGAAWARRVWRPAAVVLTAAFLAAFGAMIASQGRWAAAGQINAASRDLRALVRTWSREGGAEAAPERRESIRAALDALASRRLPAPELVEARDAVVQAGRDALRETEGDAAFPAPLEAAIRRWNAALNAYSQSTGDDRRR
jgi:rhomboid protease GluP